MANPIKCTVAGKQAPSEPFYLLHTHGEANRVVVQPATETLIWRLIEDFLDTCPDIIYVKVRDWNDPENPLEYTGSGNKQEVLETLRKFSDVVLYHGKHDLMLRAPKTLDTLGFDEHGLIFLYTDRDLEQYMEALQIPFKPEEKLPYELDHWHVTTTEADESFKPFLTALALRQHDENTEKRSLFHIARGQLQKWFSQN